MLDDGSQGAGARADTPTLNGFTSSIGNQTAGFCASHCLGGGGSSSGIAGEEQHDGHPHSPGHRGIGRAGGGHLRVRRVLRGGAGRSPSYSANLSVNAALRKQQLICDPAGSVFSGSTSTLYQPSLVSLDGLNEVNGFPPPAVLRRGADSSRSPPVVIPVKPYAERDHPAPIKTSD